MSLSSSVEVASHSPDKNIFLELSLISRLKFKSFDCADEFLFLEIDLENSLAKSKDLILNLEIKESSRKMFLSGEWDATSTLLENANYIENKYNQLPYIKFNTNLF